MNSRGLASSLLFFLGLVVLSVYADANADPQYNFQYPAGNILPFYYPNPYQHFRQGVVSSDVLPAPAISEKIPSKNINSTSAISEAIPSDQKELSIDSSLSIPSLESSTDLSAGDGKVFWTVTLTVRCVFVFVLIFNYFINT